MKIKSFLQFILEKKEPVKVPLQWSNKFSAILSKIDSPIKEALEDVRMKQISDLSLIHIGDRSDMISFSPSDKLITALNISEEKKPWMSMYFKPLKDSDALIYNRFRNQMKIGRFIKKIFLDTFSDAEIGDFVSQYKSLFDEKELKFEFLEKSDIKEGYDSTNYTFEAPTPNELMNSCMNDKPHLIDFYWGLPVKLLILKDQKGYIWGRALVWSIDSPIGKINFMDRVYAVNGENYFKFINYAKENKWWWKLKNHSDANTPLTNGEIKKRWKIDIKIDFDFESYKEWGVPYLDTFQFAQGEKLMNYTPSEGIYYELIDTEGGALEVGFESEK